MKACDTVPERNHECCGYKLLDTHHLQRLTWSSCMCRLVFSLRFLQQSERERDRQTDRQTDTDRERQTDRDRERFERNFSRKKTVFGDVIIEADCQKSDSLRDA